MSERTDIILDSVYRQIHELEKLGLKPSGIYLFIKDYSHILRELHYATPFNSCVEKTDLGFKLFGLPVEADRTDSTRLMIDVKLYKKQHSEESERKDGCL